MRMVVNEEYRLSLVVERREQVEDEEHNRYVRHVNEARRTMISGSSKAVWDSFERTTGKMMGDEHLLLGEAQRLALCIAWGFKQPEADCLADGHVLPIPLRVNIIFTEIAHSMNRRHLLSNEKVEEFIKMLKEAYVRPVLGEPDD